MTLALPISPAVTRRHRPAVGWIGGVADFATRCAVAVVLMLLFWTVAPLVLGWQSHVIMSGSMAPGLLPGDVVLSQPTSVEQVRLGQIVLVDNPAHLGTTLVHRAVGRTADGSLITRGDANAGPDSTPVPAAMVHGLPRLRVPYVGLPAVWWSTGDYRSIGLSLVAGTVLMTGLRFRSPAASGPAVEPGTGTPAGEGDGPAATRHPARHRRSRHGRHRRGR